MELTADHLTKCFDGRPALEDVNVSVSQGITAVVGPNGSGKTTLLRLLATSLDPDNGMLSFDGQPYPQATRMIRQSLGYLPQELDFPAHLTPYKLLRYMADLKGVRGEDKISSLFDRLGLTPLAHRSFERLSGGQVRMVGIAQAFLGTPKLIVLDELTSGLDVVEKERAFRPIRAMNGKGCVVFSTHVFKDVEALADQVIVLLHGRVVYSGKPEGLTRFARGSVHEASLRPEALERLEREATVSRVIASGEQVSVRILGDPPAGIPSQPVEAIMEEGYLYLMKKSLELREK